MTRPSFNRYNLEPEIEGFMNDVYDAIERQTRIMTEAAEAMQQTTQNMLTATDRMMRVVEQNTQNMHTASDQMLRTINLVERAMQLEGQAHVNPTHARTPPPGESEQPPPYTSLNSGPGNVSPRTSYRYRRWHLLKQEDLRRQQSAQNPSSNNEADRLPTPPLPPDPLRPFLPDLTPSMVLRRHDDTVQSLNDSRIPVYNYAAGHHIRGMQDPNDHTFLDRYDRVIISSPLRPSSQNVRDVRGMDGMRVRQDARAGAGHEPVNNADVPPTLRSCENEGMQASVCDEDENGEAPASCQ